MDRPQERSVIVLFYITFILGRCVWGTLSRFHSPPIQANSPTSGTRPRTTTTHTPLRLPTMPQPDWRTTKTLRLDARPLTIDEVVSVARYGRRISVGLKARKLMLASRKVVEAAIKDGEPHYGINTGFGSLSKQRIGDKDLAALQRNLVRSHAAGVGDPLPDEVVRAMMLLLAASLGRGKSGVRPVLVETIAAMLNKGVTPIVPEIGSVGASGDLAPLAAVAMVIIGEGKAKFKGRAMKGGAAMKAAGIRPVELGAKEGLALINGTHLMAGRGALLVGDAQTVHVFAQWSTAMSIDACRATHAFLDARLYAARMHDLAEYEAEALRKSLKGSQIAKSHVKNDPRVQDPYSLRAAPMVLGAFFDALANVEYIINAELGAVTDNPLVFTDKELPGVVSGANFHGLPLALPLDCLAIALCHLAGIAERRIYLMTGAFEPESHLKPFLAPRPGLQSGLMIAQYTAAACVNEMIGLATPASVSNIPTSAGMEDYNSFGPRSAAKAARAMDLCRKVIAIEFLVAAEGIEQHRPLKSGLDVEHWHQRIREYVPKLTEDRPLTDDIAAIEEMMRI